MKRASEYRQHAQECRALANQMKEGGQRDQMLTIAATWEKLAAEHEARSRSSSLVDGLAEPRAALPDASRAA